MTARMCDFCGREEVDGQYPEVIGIAPRRKQGGTNHIVNRVETGKQACQWCVRAWEDGVHRDQGSLL